MQQLSSPPEPLLWVAITIATLIMIWFTFRSKRVESIGIKVVSFFLRLAVILILAWVASNPIDLETSKEERKQHQVVLLDHSQSMSLGTSKTRYENTLEQLDGLEQDKHWSFYRYAEQLKYMGDKKDSLEKRNGDDDLASYPLTAIRQVLREELSGQQYNLLVMSDGQIHDRKHWDAALKDLRRRGIKVSTYLNKDEGTTINTAISRCVAPLTAKPGSKVEVEVRLFSQGLQDLRRKLVLKNSKGEIMRELDVDLLEGEKVFKLNFEVGIVTEPWTLELPPASAETEVEDNQYTFTIAVEEKKIRVLYLEGSNHMTYTPAGQYHETHFLPFAFSAVGGIEVDVITNVKQEKVGGEIYRVKGYDGRRNVIFDKTKGFPTSREALYRYDIVIISDINRHIFKKENFDWIIDLVIKRGGGFVMIGGDTAFDAGGWDKTVIEKIIPVDIARFGEGHQWGSIRPKITDEAAKHPIWRFVDNDKLNRSILDSHPFYKGYHEIKKAKSGADILQINPRTKSPLIAVQNYGRGRTMAFLSDAAGGWGDSYRRWGQASTRKPLPKGWEPAPLKNEYYNRFWSNSIQWLAENSLRLRQNDGLLGRSIYSNVLPGEQVPVVAEILKSGADDIDKSSYTVKANIKGAGVKETDLKWNPEAKRYESQLWIPKHLSAGEIDIEFSASDQENTVKLKNVQKIRVDRHRLEMLSDKDDGVWMKELAQASGGSFMKTDSELKEYFANRPILETSNIEQKPAWHKALFFFIILLLLSADWTIRRAFSL